VIALTRAVPASLAHCELTHLARVAIDVGRAAAQHELYEEALRALGARVVRLSETPELPDSVFVEDTAVVVDEVAVLTRPGAKSRRAEIPSAAQALASFRELRFLVPPGTLDGGDVLRIGRRLYVGLSGRSNEEGRAQLAALLSAFGFSVEGVAVSGCLHLKSAVTAIDDETLVVNPAWVDAGAFAARRRIEIDPEEPMAANVLALGGSVLVNASAPRTAERIAAAGYRVREVDQSELAKAESGLTCCSLLLAEAGSPGPAPSTG
jgi:dimethylargininase